MSSYTGRLAHRTLGLLLGALVLGSWGGGVAGCNEHQPVSLFRAYAVLGDRGIAIPPPPPSLQASTRVRIQGSIEGAALDGDTVLTIRDLKGSLELELELEAGATTFVAEDVPLDVTAPHCLELSLEGSGGEGTRHFRAEPNAFPDGSPRVVAGC